MTTSSAAFLDLSKPGVFLVTYEHLLSSAKPNSKRALIATTRRLMDAYAVAQCELLKLKQKACSSLKQWLSKRKAIKAIIRQIASRKQALITWVSKTLCFFTGGF